MTVIVFPEQFLLSFIAAFILTNLLELPFLYFSFGEKTRLLILRNLLVINGLTHPIAWMVLYFPFRSILFWQYFVVIEILVVLAETLLIRFLFEENGWKKPFLAALAMNFVSALVGVLFF